MKLSALAARLGVVENSAPRLPAADTLLGPGADEMVAVAVEAGGGRLLSLARNQVLHRPGRALTVRFSAEVAWAGDVRTRETVVAMAGVDGPPEGTLVLEAGDERVGLFRYPHDPLLPGLVAATSPDAVAERIGHRVAEGGLTVVAYRPARRAVVRVDLAGGGQRYLKVVPPSEAPALVARLDRLAGVVPAPRVLSRHVAEGLVELEAIPGRTLRDALRADRVGRVTATGPARPPEPGRVLEVLERLDTVDVTDLAPHWTVPEMARGLGAMLSAVLPTEAERLAALGHELGREVPQRQVAVHGDLHPAQFLVQRSTITGVLDLDDLGPGARVDDLATFLGHVVAFGVEGDQPPARRYAARLLPVFGEATDPDELRRRTAAVLLGLATGPYRVQQPDWPEACRRRIALAERWALGDVRSLREAS
ncbi:phosphotransferase [Rhabdothermincola salaria]|uniref:phosphotransferase n=1 Tax=Rhabdothermincola salaria TaxID=2903142 RepID=UPI001E3714D4|nr:phosphotransferase [Rhabdothermincola salaria]MCD9624758.1 phosphotransferase [Rhabdothermincola salaria]